MACNIAFALVPDVEDLDYAGPYGATTADRANCARQNQRRSGFC